MDVTIQVTGLKDFQAGVRKIDNDLGPALRKALNEVADIVAGTARPLVPVRSGKAAGSIKVGSTQRAAQIKVGGKAAPYYLWLDFGGKVGRDKSVHREFVKAGRYIYPSLSKKRDAVMEKLEEVLGRVAQQAGFEVRDG